METVLLPSTNIHDVGKALNYYLEPILLGKEMEKLKFNKMQVLLVGNLFSEGCKMN